MADIDFDFVKEYIHRTGYGKTAEDYLRENKNFVINQSGKERRKQPFLEKIMF